MTEHKARQYGDELYCRVCGKTWDVNDPDPPPCIDRKAVGRESIKSMKEKLKGEDDA